MRPAPGAFSPRRGDVPEGLDPPRSPSGGREQASASIPAGQPRAIGGGGSTPSRRVLVVDHHRDAADTLATVLRLHGHRVRVVYDGRDAPAAAEALRAEVALVDMGMPWADPEEIARALRDVARGRGRLLVIGMGTPGTPGTERMPPAASRDIAALLAKPAGVPRLLGLLRPGFD